MSSHTDGCGDFRALASSWLDGELDELESARLERHLGVCDPCMTWTRDADALARWLHESQSVSPTWSFGGSARALRWRFVRVASVGAAAASAAAVAAFVLAQPGSGRFFFPSASGSRPVAEAPCVSCTKKQALTFGSHPRARHVVMTTAPIHSHVTNPLADLQ